MENRGSGGKGKKKNKTKESGFKKQAEEGQELML